MANSPLIRSGAVIIVSVAVATVIAVYESPQARQFAEDVRRRLAYALHSLGEELNPSLHARQPRYNRPEDADGFIRSRAEPGVDAGRAADDESKRRQREELMYWNALHLERKSMSKEQPSSSAQGSSFEDFLKEDLNAEEQGTFVYSTGTDMHGGGQEEGVIHRGADRLRSVANPFAKKHYIHRDDLQRTHKLSANVSRNSDNMCASVEVLPLHDTAVAITKQVEHNVDTSSKISSGAADPPVSYPTFQDIQLHNMNRNTHAHSNEVFASIHAWADHTSRDRVARASPITRYTVPSDTQVMEHDSDDPPISIPDCGEDTPTESMSIAGSTAEMWQESRSNATSELDVMSIEGISTPGTWTEIGSEVSEHENVQ